MKISTKIIKTFNIVLCSVIFVFFYGNVWQKLTEQNAPFTWKQLFNIDFIHTGILTGIVLMMFLNWIIEALKMQILIKRLHPVSLLTSLKSVWTGVTFSFLFPNRFGEFIGRSFFFHHERLKIGLIAIVSSWAQMLITLFIGTIGLMIHLQIFSSNLFVNLWSLIAVGLVCTITGFLYFKLSWSAQIVKRWRFNWLKKQVQKIEILSEFSARELFKILCLSLLRYFIFFVQFYGAFHFFNIELSFFHALIFIPVYYVLLMAIPSFAITEIGVRGTVSIFLFSALAGGDNGLIFAASTLIWLINILIPAIIGSCFLTSTLFKK